MSLQKNPRQKSSSKNKRGGEKRFPIIGIGASAGGIEAFKAFFTSLPACPNAAIICIIHLSLQKKSSLAELFAHSFKHLHFREILDKEVVRPGFVYINSSGKPVSIEKGKFKISLPDTKSPLLTINHFFRSLAAWQGDLSIGIILSGAGSDGTLGLGEIKAAGGIVMAQKPSTAEFNIMPMSAITAGLPDFVASPQDLGPMVDQCINRLILGDFNGQNGPIDLPGSDLDALFTILLGKTNIHFEYYKKNVVARRVYRRMSLATMPSPDEYLAFLKKSPKEIFSLANDLMIGVTSFFRDPDAWEILQGIVVKDLISKGAAEKPLRVWVPACSTGEEAYTIAMMLQLQAEKSGTPRTFQIFATDINEKALKLARKGSYPASVSENIPDEYVRRYFIAGQDGSSMDIVKSTRDIVVFAKQNILVDPPFSKVDLIICRNLFIYLETQAQEKCLSLFHYALNPDGCLFMGNAESTGKLHSLFKSLGNKKCRLYKRIGADRPQLKKMALPFDAGSDTHGPMAWFSSPGDSSVQAVAQQELLKKFAPAVVVINASYSVVYYSGPTNKFLSQPGGAPTNKLLDQVPDAMRNRLRRHLLQAIHDGKPRVMLFPMPGKNKKMRQVAISITFLAKTVSDGDLYAVSFEEQGFLKSAQEMDAEPCDADGPLFRQLEHELASTRDELQGNIEQLKSLNEEMHSSNEELQAANEELETSREELQSLNEELVTVNAQLQETVEAQEITKNDLNNFFISTDIPTIFLDKDLKIKRFTPAMTRIVKFIEADIGRPFGEFSQDNIGPELAVDTEEVLHKLAAVSREVRCGDKWFIRQTLPYRTADDRVEGVVVTFTDITLRKQAEGSLIRLASIVESSDDAIFSKDLNGVIRSWNQGAEKIFGYSARETIGQPVTMLLPADRMDEEEKILHALRSGGHVKHLETIRLTKDGRRINVLITSSPLKDEQGRIVGISKIVHDITDRKNAEKALQESRREIDFLASVIESSSQPFGVGYPDGRLGLINKAFERLTGYSGDELRTIDWGKALTPPEWAEIEQKKLAELNDTGVPVRYEKEYVRKDGTRIPIELLVHVVKDGDGRPLYYNSFLTDITERKRAEEVLRKSEERYKAITSNTPDHILIQDLELRYLLVVNPQLGLTEKDMLGKTDYDILTKEDADNVTKIKKQVIETDAPAPFETTLIDLEGKRQFFEGSYVPKHDALGRVDGLIGYFRNVTEQKLSEEALRESEDRYRTLFNSLIEGFCIIEMIFDADNKPVDYRFLEINEAFEEQTGLHNAQGKLMRDLAPDHEEQWFEIYGKIAMTGEPAEFVNEAKAMDRWFEVYAFRMGGSDSRKVAICFSDITGRKKAENALKEQNEISNAILNATTETLWLMDLEGNILGANETAAKRLGKSVAELIGKNGFALTPPHVKELRQAKIREMAQTGKAVQFQDERDGIIFHHAFYPVRDTLGAIKGLVIFSRDITQQKKAEDALKISEERFRTMFERHQAVMLLIEPESGAIMDANAAAVEFYGHSKEQLLSLKISDINQLPKEKVAEELEKALEERRTNFVFPHRLANGEVRWVEVYSSPSNARGKKLLFSIIHDITDRKKGELELIQLNRTLSAHSKSSQAMMRAEDEENYLNEVCKIITNDFGYKMVWIGFAENDAQKSVRPVASAGFEQGYLEKLNVTWADSERGRGPTGTAIRSGKPNGCMNMLTDPNFAPWREEALRRGYASSVVLPLLNGNKAFGAVTIYSKKSDSFSEDEIKLLTDLSDDLAYGILAIRIQEARKSAEEAVLKERNFCNAIIQTTSGLIIVLDPEGRIELFNHACEKATGYIYKELKGKPFWDYLLLPEEKDGVKDVFSKIKDGNINAEMEFENYWVGKDKSQRFIRWANSALKDAKGKVELIIGTGIDMTDDKVNRKKIDELNSFLMQKTTDLLAANKELESFSYSVSHDLRGPLRTIKGFSDILLEDYGDKFDANGQEFMSRIKSGADKMNELIDDMLSLAKISRQEMNLEEIDLSAMVSAIIVELQQTEPQRSIKTLIAQGIHGRADARLVNIVLSNLIGNAWKYSSKTPHAVIEFGTVEISGEKTYFIKDNGAGFDMTHAKRLFTPFQRLHSENEFPGTGIGLAIVSKVIQRHGGRIWPKSEIGKGACFHFTLSVDKRKSGGG